MKKTLTIAIVTFALSLSAQEKASVEKSVTGIQIGFFGAEFYNEARLADKWSLRNGVALYPSIWGGDLYNKAGFALAPAISVTPKYYYNLQK
jgi:hypothetical protein